MVFSRNLCCAATLAGLRVMPAAYLNCVHVPLRLAAAQGAYSANAQKDKSGYTTRAARGRAVALTIVEGALCALLQPLTLLLPAATGLFALREVGVAQAIDSRWLSHVATPNKS